MPEIAMSVTADPSGQAMTDRVVTMRGWSDGD